MMLKRSVKHPILCYNVLYDFVSLKIIKSQSRFGEIILMKNLREKYPVVITLTLICLLFAIVTSFYEGMYDLFARV